MSAPYIPLYIDDFDGATAHLSLEEEGAYMRLIKLAWRTPGCSIVNDDAWIARKIRMTPDAFESIGRPILKEFFKLSRGRWVQVRLKKEFDKLADMKRERSEAGKRGGVAKALKNKGIDPSKATALNKQPEPEPEPIRIDTIATKCADEPAWKMRLTEAAEAAGDQLDQTSPAIHHAADLTALVQPSSGEPCTWPEVIDAVRMTAVRSRRSGRKIRSWSWIRDDAIALRDKRLNSAMPDAAALAETQPRLRSESLGERIAAERTEANRIAHELLAEDARRYGNA